MSPREIDVGTIVFFVLAVMLVVAAFALTGGFR